MNMKGNNVDSQLNVHEYILTFPLIFTYDKNMKAKPVESVSSISLENSLRLHFTQVLLC